MIKTMIKPKLNDPDVEPTTTTIMVDIEKKPKPINTSKLPCANCEWRYSLFCPKCEWNKKGNVKVY